MNRTLLLMLAGLGLLTDCRTPDSAAPQRSLRRAAAGKFPIGVGLNDRIPERPQDWALLTTPFSMVTPENCMKPASVQPAEGQFHFERADAFVDFAAREKLPVVGHCLVWAKDDRTPAWFFRDGEKPASRELLLARMRRHIETEVTHYRGRSAMWNVVNEALDDGPASNGTNALRSRAGELQGIRMRKNVARD